VSKCVSSGIVSTEKEVFLESGLSLPFVPVLPVNEAILPRAGEISLFVLPALNPFLIGVPPFVKDEPLFL
jgi:hypothetical protein